MAIAEKQTAINTRGLGVMTNQREGWVLTHATACVVAVILTGSGMVSESARADEGGVSFWLPGNYGSLAAVPVTPGWSFAAVPYYTSVSGGTAVARARDIEIGNYNPTITVNLDASLNSTARLIFLAPSYTFESPVLGAQASLGLTTIAGNADASISGTITVTTPGGNVTRPFYRSDSVSGFGDLYPQASLKWSRGVSNFMVYVTGDIPVGAYDSTRLINLGIGHAAIDAGGGYTYLNLSNGRELSAVAGFTYNTENTDTNYENGVDFHLDWAVSQFLSEQVLVGMVGYYYDQVSGDSGTGNKIGSFESRVVGLGPQVSYIAPLGHLQGYLNLKAYWEFDAQNRASGHNVWLTFSISPAALAAAAKTALNQR